ncbi:MAG: hypothetical protein ABIH38_04150 [Patescibacteria group bacterium]
MENKPVMGESQENKLLAAISYLWIISIIMLVIKKDSKLVQFHAKQGLVLCIASIIFWLIPGIGWIINLAVVVAIVVGFIKALSGEYYKIPAVSIIAEKINF